ncbi:MAG TPA: DegT/DnrJ/EryC1/StrS family aminotransferase [bacterium]|nr:DegT/DnrJ/EryC1/StrS family aminotransferase [bacterium]
MEYRVPFINYPLQYKKIKEEIDEAFFRIMESGDLIYRSDMVKFEKDIASFVGKKYGIGTGSCTGALFLSLYANGIGPGDEVITVDHTYIATIDVIVRCGATPVLVDIRDDFNMDPDLIEAAITKRTKAIIPVHLNGRCCEMDKIMEIARRHNLLVIEDAAQALGAKYNQKPAGSFGKTSCFSFYPAKILGSYGEAGMVCTDDEELAHKLYLLRDHGEKPSYLKTEEEKKSKDSKIYCWGFNTILDNLQAAFLNVKLKHFPEWIKRRREIASFYNEGLSGVGDLILPPAPEQEGRFFDVFQNYVIRSKQRDSLAQYLESRGVETLIKWKTPNYRQENLKELHRFNLPKTDQISQEVLSLPIYPELEDAQVEYVIKCVRDFFAK